MCRNHPAVGILALTALLRKDDRTISNGNVEPGARCHVLSFPHKDHLQVMEIQYARNEPESGGFSQYGDEYQLDGYPHKMLLSDRKYAHISHLLRPV